MSFSKAKIQRFNELGSEAPPPGAYDPKFDSKGKGFAIEKAGRFNDNRSTASSGADCSHSVSSKGVAPLPSPKFRTPQLPKKRLTKTLTSSCPKAKTKLVLNPKECKYDTRDELADLKVECANKDKTIQDHEKCIDDMKNEVKRLETLLSDVQRKQRDVEEQHKKDLESMANLQQDILNARDQKHHTELTLLRTQLLEALESKENEYSAREKVEKELKSKITDLLIKCELLETELTNERRKSKEYDELSEKCQRLEREMESRERELIEQLNEMEINKEIVASDLTDTIMENEKKLIEAQEEVKQLKMTINGLSEDLQSSERNNDFLQAECERLQEEVELLTNVRRNLEESLETRQQVVLDMQCQLSALQCEMDELKAENERIATESQQKISELISNHATEITELTTEFLSEKHKFQDERNADLSKLLEVERKNKDLLTKNEALIMELCEVQKKYDDLKVTYQEVENELDNEREFSDLLEDNHREELRKLKLQIDEMKSPKTEKKGKKSSKNSPNSADTPKNSSEAKSLEEKLLERDSQIEELTAALEELKLTSATQESFSQSLQEELDRAEAELADKKKELKDLKEQIREETAEMVTRRRRFEVVMAQNQATVVALSQRLAESTDEVDRLQQELKSAEELIVEQRNVLNNMRDSSKLVNDQMLSLIDQIDTQQLLDELEKTNLSEIETLKTLFESKIDELKSTSQGEIRRLRSECEKKENQCAEMAKELKEMSEKLNCVQDMLLTLEERSDAQCIEISELQLSKAKVEQQLKDHIKNAENRESSLKSEIEKYKISSESAEKRTTELLKIVESLKKDQLKYENLKKVFEEQKTLLQEEMSFRKIAEEETKKLVETCERLKKNYREMTEKYTELVDHQNHKQRVKQLNQLKEKINNLEKDLEEKCQIVDQQSKTIEKFQADERRRTFTKGKENFSTISKSPFGTPVSSPHKPLTPLRERNE